MDRDMEYDKLISGRNEKANSMLKRGGYKRGGHVHEDEAQDKKLIKKEMSKAKIKLKDGGAADGKMSKSCVGKYARGGAAAHKKGTTVNVIVASKPQGGAAPMMPPGAGAAPMRPPMAPPAGGAPMPPQAGAMPPHPPMKRGGGIKLSGGAGGAEGRMEKAKIYGPKPRNSGGKC